MKKGIDVIYIINKIGINNPPPSLKTVVVKKILEVRTTIAIRTITSFKNKVELGFINFILNC